MFPRLVIVTDGGQGVASQLLSCFTSGKQPSISQWPGHEGSLSDASAGLQDPMSVPCPCRSGETFHVLGPGVPKELPCCSGSPEQPLTYPIQHLTPHLNECALCADSVLSQRKPSTVAEREEVWFTPPRFLSCSLLQERYSGMGGMTTTTT